MKNEGERGKTGMAEKKRKRTDDWGYPVLPEIPVPQWDFREVPKKKKKQQEQSGWDWLTGE